jgi:hypothetical protein
MATSPDFIEKEIQKVLDILEKQCVQFDVTTDSHLEETNVKKKREERNQNGVRQDA